MGIVQFRKDYEVLSRHADPKGQLSVRALITMLFDAADLHAHQWMLSLGQLSETSQTWVLSRLHIELDRQPEWDSQIQVETWATGSMRMFAGRDFRILADGSPVGHASTLWLMIDRKSRKPVPLPSFVEEVETPAGSPVVSFASIKAPAHDSSWSATYRVGWNHLDLNRHATAMVYLDWLLSPLPAHIQEANGLRRLDLIFREEAFEGDSVRVEISTSPEARDSAFVHIAKQEHTLLASARTEWRPRQATDLTTIK